MSLDRLAFADIISEGQATIAGTMPPPPAGAWGVSTMVNSIYNGWRWEDVWLDR